MGARMPPVVGKIVFDQAVRTPFKPIREPMRVTFPTIIRKDSWVPEDLAAKIKLARQFEPKTRIGAIVKDCLHYLPPDLAAELVSRITDCIVIETDLRVLIRRHPGSEYRAGLSLIEDHGVTSRKVITNAGVAFMVDAFRNIVELELFNYHGIGTAITAEAATQTALTTEATTQYNPDNTRATGTQSAPAANQYRSTGTNTVDAAITVEEHGLFSQAATGGGTLWDRSLTGTQTLSNGDGIQTQHTTTINSGG